MPIGYSLSVEDDDPGLMLCKRNIIVATVIREHNTLMSLKSQGKWCPEDKLFEAHRATTDALIDLLIFDQRTALNAWRRSRDMHELLNDIEKWWDL
jgi:hypothetical protein